MTILIFITSIFLLIVGSAKLLGAKPLADQFEEFGLPKAAMYAVGACEITAAITLHLSPLRLYTSCALILLMLGAIYSHIKVNHPLSSNAPAIIVLIASLVIGVGSIGTAGELFSILGLT